MTDRMTALIGLSLVLCLAIVLLAYLFGLRSVLRLQGRAISRAQPGAVVVSCTAAFVTTLALRRIGRSDGKRYGPTGRVYSLAASQGHLRLLRGRTAETIADFDSDAIRDVRVGTTSWGLADYTTLFFGITVGGNTYELPIRINGPRQTSMLTASREWADDRAAMIIRELGLLTMSVDVAYVLDSRGRLEVLGV